MRPSQNRTSSPVSSAQLFSEQLVTVCNVNFLCCFTDAENSHQMEEINHLMSMTKEIGPQTGRSLKIDCVNPVTLPYYLPSANREFSFLHKLMQTYPGTPPPSSCLKLQKPSGRAVFSNIGLSWTPCLALYSNTALSLHHRNKSKITELK